MNLAFVIISDQYSGAENFVKEIAENIISSSKSSVTIICNEEITKYYKNSNDIKLINVGMTKYKNRLRRFWAYKKAATLLRKNIELNKYDLIHLNLEASILIGSYARIFEICPYLITLHGGEIKQFSDNTTLIYRKLIKPRVTKIMDCSKKIITISDWQVEKLPNRYKGRLIKIPNGVDISRFNLRGSTSNKVIALFVGRLIEVKGVNEIMGVTQLFPQIDFWFVGSGILEKKLVGNNVKYIGFVENDKLPKYYNKATFCVFPSYHEPFSLVGLEAMASGKPIICTSKGFTEYAVNDYNSLVIKTESVASLSDAIKKISNDSPLRKRLGKNARRTALNYDWSKIANQYLKIFNEIRSK
jgi:glycosyltransferase involved in cell wall biosynthesis